MKEEKIIRKLLEVSYPGLNIDSLLLVVNATPNPVIATEILCDMYEKPEIGEPGRKFLERKNSYNEHNITFHSFDIFQEEVTYTYQEKEVKVLFIPNESLGKLSFDDITEEYYSKFNSNRYSCKQIADTLGMTEEDFRKSYTNVSLRGPIKEFVYKRKVRLTDWQEI